MIKDFLTRMAEGLAAPRRSVRWILSRGPQGFDTILGILVLGYLVQSLAVLVIPGVRPSVPGSLIAWHVAGFTMQVVVFLLTSVMAFGLGRLFGGRGTLDQSFLVMAWYSLVTSVLSPLLLYGFAGSAGDTPNALAALLLLGASGLGVVLLAAFVAELHGFRSVLIVLGAILGLSVALSFVLLAAMPPA